MKLVAAIKPLGRIVARPVYLNQNRLLSVQNESFKSI
jgi:hypothetical protein